MTTLEEFRDLSIRGSAEDRTKLRQALIAKAVAPWRHVVEKQMDASAFAGRDDVLVFERDAADGLASAGLFLWPRLDGYEITNIVPRETSDLGIHAYNALLQDFLVRVADPAAAETGFRVETTTAQQSLDDWLPKNIADALRRFSGAANKSTGSSHPYDRQRWFAFLFAVHDHNEHLDTTRLMRWLVEIEGWSEDKAIELVTEYEFALGLLDQYDVYRGR
jgi:hypothetical protein